MSAFIFCTSFIDELNTVKRWECWLEYYGKHREALGADRLFLIDDGTPAETNTLPLTVVSADEPLPVELPSGNVMFRFGSHLGRKHVGCFPGWWRSFTFSYFVAQHYGFDKIIHIESDAFVLTRRMMDYIESLRQG